MKTEVIALKNKEEKKCIHLLCCQKIYEKEEKNETLTLKRFHHK